MEPGVSGAAWLGMPPGNENCLNSRFMPSASRVMFGNNSLYSALQIRVRHHPGTAVAGPADVDHVEIVLLDQPVAVHINEIQAGRGAPVAQQPRLDVFHPQRLGEQGIVEEIDLSDRQIVGGAPVGIDFPQFIGPERPGWNFGGIGEGVGLRQVLQRKRHSSLIDYHALFREPKWAAGGGIRGMWGGIQNQEARIQKPEFRNTRNTRKTGRGMTLTLVLPRLPIRLRWHVALQRILVVAIILAGVVQIPGILGMAEVALLLRPAPVLRASQAGERAQ